MYRPFPSGTVSGKMSAETHNRVEELYNRWFPDDVTVSFKAFFEKLINEFNRNPVANDQEYQQLLDTIKNLIDEKTVLTAELQVMKDKTTELEHENFRINGLNAILQENSEQTVNEQAIIVEAEPIIREFLTLMAGAASKKTGKPVTEADILKNLFWEQIVNGPGDHLPLIITRAQITAMIKKIKESRPNE